MHAATGGGRIELGDGAGADQVFEVGEGGG